jgi:microsomal dipeptidase-like Zn-dependent dipeptidase
MITDLHCHYPMHLLAQDAPPSVTWDRLVRRGRRPRWLDRLRAAVLRIAARHLNYREASSSWRVTFDGLEQARTGVVLSVLYEPFAEIDLDELPGSDPESGYFTDLLEHLDRVEGELASIDPGGSRHLVARSAGDLDAALASDRLAFVHCVEGGFHLGSTPEAISVNVAELARRGVAYVTLAHLFYRGIATNAPALPMLSDAMYRRIFRQPRNRGLTKLGEAAVRAMYTHRVLVDVSHMRADALIQTFALLDRLDREHGADPTDFPVISSHAGYRFGTQAYMHDAATIKQIARRDGVIGVILARHQLQDGLDDGEGIEHTVRTLKAHIDAIHDVTDSYAHIAIGSDLDGFIKPTMGGVEAAADLGRLQAPLRELYRSDADAILSDNGRRVVRHALAQRGG